MAPILPDVSIGVVSGLVVCAVVYGVHGLVQLALSGGRLLVSELVPDPGAVLAPVGDPVPVGAVGVVQ